jgi:hypothetical protein
MQYHLAQINIARMLGPIDSPVMAEFVANLDPINLLAESSDGFIWRLKDESNSATQMQFFDDAYMIVNMSVWSSVESLFNYTYRTMHMEVFKKRHNWFEKMPEMHYALWYVPAGHQPTVAEAMERLVHLRNHGETPYAFSFKKKFTVGQLTISPDSVGM